MSHFLEALEGRTVIREDEHSFLEQMQMQKTTGEWVSLLMLATNTSRESQHADQVVRLLVETGADVNLPQQKDQSGGMPTVFLEAVFLNRLHLADLMLKHGADASAHTPSGTWAATLPFKHLNTLTQQLAKDLLLRIAASERGEASTPDGWMRNFKTLPRLAEWAERSPKLKALLAAAGQGKGTVSTKEVGCAVVSVRPPACPVHRQPLRQCARVRVGTRNEFWRFDRQLPYQGTAADWLLLWFRRSTTYHSSRPL
jgi:hypothetical protein